MEAKDYLSIVISAVAVLIALSSFLLSSYRKTNDDRRALRSSLNDIIAKIFLVRIEYAKYIQGNPNWPQNDLAISVNNLFTSQLNSYARMADYIIPKISGLVSDIELATVAETFTSTGEQAGAVSYWQAAIRTCKNINQEVKYRRTYAAYLYNIGKLGDGREEFQKALDLFRDNDDTSKAQNGATYKFWGLCEIGVDNSTVANNYFCCSRDLYSSMANNMVRLPLLKDLSITLSRMQQFKSDPLQAMGLGPIAEIVPPAKEAEEVLS